MEHFPITLIGDTDHKRKQEIAVARITRRHAPRLKQLREAIENERISMDEIAELQSLSDFIDPGDTTLLEWAGVPES
jgi:hypothetical protein